MKKSTNLLDSLDLLGHEITNEKLIKIKKLALENMKMTGAYLLISEWAKKGKKYFTVQEFKSYEGFDDLTDEEINFRLQVLLRDSLVYHNDKSYKDDTKLYFSDSYLERLDKRSLTVWKDVKMY